MVLSGALIQDHILKSILDINKAQKGNGDIYILNSAPATHDLLRWKIYLFHFNKLIYFYCAAYPLKRKII